MAFQGFLRWRLRGALVFLGLLSLGSRRRSWKLGRFVARIASTLTSKAVDDGNGANVVIILLP